MVVATKPDVLTEILDGKGLSIAEVCQILGDVMHGKPLIQQTIARWIVDGCLMPDGSRVRLEATRVAGRRLTSRPALERFIAAQNVDGPTKMLRGRAIYRVANKAEANA